MTDRPPRRLRLVHPAKPAPKQERKIVFYKDLFTPEEQGRLRAALHHARFLFGSRDCLGAVLGACRETISGMAYGRIPVSGALAIRLSRALGVPLESLYRAPTDASVCPTCGRSKQP
jgi:hypothetical protein